RTRYTVARLTPRVLAIVLADSPLACIRLTAHHKNLRPARSRGDGAVDVFGEQLVNVFGGRSMLRVVQVVGMIDVRDVVVKRQLAGVAEGLGVADPFVAKPSAL